MLRFYVRKSGQYQSNNLSYSAFALIWRRISSNATTTIVPAMLRRSLAQTTLPNHRKSSNPREKSGLTQVSSVFLARHNTDVFIVGPLEGWRHRISSVFPPVARPFSGKRSVPLSPDFGFFVEAAPNGDPRLSAW